MDGVLVDFNRGFETRTGRRICSFQNSKEFWKFANNFPDLYRHPPMMEDALDLVEYVNGLKGVKVEILTAIPHSMPQAEKHKAQWIEEHMPYGWKFKIGPHSVDKQFHARPGDILIDDKDKNIEQWINAGGVGILHKSAETSIDELKKVLNENT